MVGCGGRVARVGNARAWGIVNWEAERFVEASRRRGEQGVPAPCAAQLPYSLVSRTVESPEMAGALAARARRGGVLLAGGVLTGKYDGGGAGGRRRRAATRAGAPPARDAGGRLRALPPTETTAAALAIAFTMAHPAGVTVLLGATSADQVAENAVAADLLARLDGEQLARLRAIGV